MKLNKLFCSLTFFVLVIGYFSKSNASSIPVCHFRDNPQLKSPVTKVVLNSIAVNTGLNIKNELPRAFENFALNTVESITSKIAANIIRNASKFRNGRVQFPLPLVINRKNQYAQDSYNNFLGTYTSPEMFKRTNNKRREVAPDGVGSIGVIRDGVWNNEIYSGSSFYDAKALQSGTSLTLRYPTQSSQDPDEPDATFDAYQILGFIDALRYSPAARSRQDVVPDMTFLTTAGVIIPQETVMVATSYRVGIYHSIACYSGERLRSGINPVLRMSPPELLNPQPYQAVGLSPILSTGAEPGKLSMDPEKVLDLSRNSPR